MKDVYKRQVSTSVMNLRFEYRNPIVCKWGENMMVNVGITGAPGN